MTEEMNQESINDYSEVIFQKMQLKIAIPSGIISNINSTVGHSITIVFNKDADNNNDNYIIGMVSKISTQLKKDLSREIIPFDQIIINVNTLNLNNYSLVDENQFMVTIDDHETMIKNVYFGD